MDNVFVNITNFPYSLDCTSPVPDPSPVQTDSVLSDTSLNDDVAHPRCSISDEEIILASDRPKRRAGRKKFKETRHPIFRGIRKRNSNKWVCEIREPIKQKRIWLGTYPTADMAARAHDVAVLALKGQSATLNFADSVWRLPMPVSKDPKDIRKAAIEGAEKFRPKISGEMGPVRPEIDDLEMDSVLVRMAEYPLFSPTPRIGRGFSWDDADDDVEVSLWSY